MGDINLLGTFWRLVLTAAGLVAGVLIIVGTLSYCIGYAYTAGRLKASEIFVQQRSGK